MDAQMNINDSSTNSYDQIADWYGKLRGEGSLSLVDDLVYPHLVALTDEHPTVCDLGCGEGKLSRILAQRGCSVIGVDISQNLLAIANKHEERQPLGISYIHDNAESLDRLGSGAFDVVICNMALMDMPNLKNVFHSVYRVLKQKGTFAFTITHPCFDSPHSKWVESNNGGINRNISEYFAEGFWRSKNPRGIRGRVGAHHRMLSTYINYLIDVGFIVEAMIEPKASSEATTIVPGFAVAPVFLLVQSRK